MIYLISALSAGLAGGLVVAVIPENRARLRNFCVLFFSVSAMILS